MKGGETELALVLFLPLVSGLLGSDVASGRLEVSSDGQFLLISSTMSSVKGIIFKASIIELGLSFDAPHSFSHIKNKWRACGS